MQAKSTKKKILIIIINYQNITQFAIYFPFFDMKNYKRDEILKYNFTCKSYVSICTAVVKRSVQ